MGFGWKSPSGPASDAEGKHQLGSSNANGSASSGGTAGAPGRGLAVVPEKAAMGHNIRSTVPAQYWGAHVASATAPDGAVFTAVADPAPLPLLSGSGLSRPHLVLATQAVSLPGRPSLPGLPSLCQEQGGAVSSGAGTGGACGAGHGGMAQLYGELFGARGPRRQHHNASSIRHVGACSRVYTRSSVPSRGPRGCWGEGPMARVPSAVSPRSLKPACGAPVARAPRCNSTPRL